MSSQKPRLATPEKAQSQQKNSKKPSSGREGRLIYLPYGVLYIAYVGVERIGPYVKLFCFDEKDRVVVTFAREPVKDYQTIVVRQGRTGKTERLDLDMNSLKKTLDRGDSKPGKLGSIFKALFCFKAQDDRQNELFEIRPAQERELDRVIEGKKIEMNGQQKKKINVGVQTDLK